LSSSANIEPKEVVSETQQFRSQVGHISRHSGVLVAGTIFSVALGYVFKIYLARVLGPEALGLYALGFTLAGFVSVFNSLGLVEAAVRFAAVYRAAQQWERLRALLWRGAAILMVANLVCAALFMTLGKVVALRFYHSPALVPYLPWFAAVMVLGVISTFYGRILAGYREIGRRTVIVSFIGSPVNMFLAVLLISLRWGLRGYIFANIASTALVIALMLAAIWKLTPPEARFSMRLPPALQPEVWSFSATAVGVLLLEFLSGHVDKIALGYYLGARDVGIYAVAAAVVAYISLVLNSVNQVFSPMIADLHTRKDFVMLGRLYKALTKWVLGLTLPMAITVMVFARPFMRIFGHDFEAGWPILIIGTAGQLVNCGVGSVGLILMMSGNQRRLLRVQASMVVVMVLVNVMLVPIWGILGAAIAAALTNVGSNLWNLYEVRKNLGFTPYSRSYVRLLVPTSAVVLVALFAKYEAAVFRWDWLAIAVTLLLTYCIFAGISLAFGLDDDDRLIATAMWSKIHRPVPPLKGIDS